MLFDGGCRRQAPWGGRRLILKNEDAHMGNKEFEISVAKTECIYRKGGRAPLLFGEMRSVFAICIIFPSGQ